MSSQSDHSDVAGDNATETAESNDTVSFDRLSERLSDDEE